MKLGMAVSHHEDSGNQTQVFCKHNSALNTELAQLQGYVSDLVSGKKDQNYRATLGRAIILYLIWLGKYSLFKLRGGGAHL